MVELARRPQFIPPEVTQKLQLFRAEGPNPVRIEWDYDNEQFIFIETITHGRSNDGNFSVNQGGHTG